MHRIVSDAQGFWDMAARGILEQFLNRNLGAVQDVARFAIISRGTRLEPCPEAKRIYD
jgi:hypothetical protein